MKKTLLLFILSIFFVPSGFGQSWTEIEKLEALDQQIDDNHALSVAISDNYAIAGAWHEDHDVSGGNSLNNAGAAYIHHYNSATKLWSQEAKLIAADREVGDVFGTSVDISGTYAVIGAVEENAARGAAYVFEKNGSGIWIQVAKLEAPIRKSSDRFGYSVSIVGNTIVVGAHHEDEDENELNTLQNAGSAYVYTRVAGVWGFAQKIAALDRDSGNEFGYSVAISETEDKIIVGAYKYDPFPPTFDVIGGAYVFELISDTWTQIKALTAATPHHGDRFGWSVDVSGTYYIIGAPYHDFDDVGGDAKNNAGAAYIFDSSNSWAQDKVVGGDRNGQDNTGEDVAIYGTRAVVGAPLQDYDIDGDPPYWGNGGAAFVFEKDGSGFWNQTQKLLAEDRFSGDKFGYSVALSNTFIISGAPEDNGGSLASTGALYVFEDESLGVNDITFNSPPVIFPNPTNGTISIDLENVFTEIDLTITNSLGQVIYHKTHVDTKLIQTKINGSSGVYFVNLNPSEGKTTTQKVIKN